MTIEFSEVLDMATRRVDRLMQSQTPAGAEVIAAAQAFVSPASDDEWLQRWTRLVRAVEMYDAQGSAL